MAGEQVADCIKTADSDGIFLAVYWAFIVDRRQQLVGITDSVAKL